jgi:hypothetical protein
LGVHNKMVLAHLDERGYVHVGSINGSEGSSKVNRELALQVQADPTPHTVDLSAYKIGDAAQPDDYEGMVQFPPGTAIPPRGVLVAAVTVTGSREEFPALMSDFEILDSEPAVPNLLEVPAWGQREWGLGSDADKGRPWMAGTGPWMRSSMVREAIPRSCPNPAASATGTQSSASPPGPTPAIEAPAFATGPSPVLASCHKRILELTERTRGRRGVFFGHHGNGGWRKALSFRRLPRSARMLPLPPPDTATGPRSSCPFHGHGPALWPCPHGRDQSMESATIMLRVS